MNPMASDNDTQGRDGLDRLWTKYRAACPDPAASASFLPGLWQKIDARRRSTTFLFRRWAEVCIVASAAAALMIATLVIPRYERAPVYQAHYIDILAADDSIADVAMASPVSETDLPGDLQ